MWAVVYFILLYIGIWLLPKNWQKYCVYLVSTINALQCSYNIIYINDKYYDLFYQGDDYVVASLNWFAAYLFVDGVFHITKFEITNVLHHFVGGLGIYMIAKTRIGMGLGLYFAGTEISTPLLNLSWLLIHTNDENKLVFITFWVVFFMARIATVPLLLNYIYINSAKLNQLDLFKWLLGYGGSLTLILLNIVWFHMITKKIVKMIR